MWCLDKNLTTSYTNGTNFKNFIMHPHLLGVFFFCQWNFQPSQMSKNKSALSRALHLEQGTCIGVEKNMLGEFCLLFSCLGVRVRSLVSLEHAVPFIIMLRFEKGRGRESKKKKREKISFVYRLDDSFPQLNADSLYTIHPYLQLQLIY